MTYPDANTLGTAVVELPAWLRDDVARFNERWEVDETIGCHLWAGRIGGAGYGRFEAQGVHFSAHRFAYEVAHRAPIAAGVVLDHLCRVRRCVNPEHLDPVQQVTNIRRGDTGQNNATKTHCPYGHEFTPENTYVIPATGGRTCRSCARRRRSEYEERRQLARAG